MKLLVIITGIILSLPAFAQNEKVPEKEEVEKQNQKDKHEEKVFENPFETGPYKDNEYQFKKSEEEKEDN
jgi:hypothetical protein